MAQPISNHSPRRAKIPRQAEPLRLGAHHTLPGLTELPFHFAVFAAKN
jgi:hypothetical protein